MLQLLKENLSFIAMCIAVFAALFVAAYIFERALKVRRPKNTAAYAAYIGMFSALSGVLMLLELPLFFAPGFYKLDLSEIPVLICTFTLGPVSGIITEFLKIVVKLFLKGTSTAFVGEFANFVVGCSMVLPASIIYHTGRNRKTAVAGLAVGGFSMTVFGSAFNAIYLLPKFAALFGWPLESIVAMGTEVNSSITSVSTLVLFAVVPLNLLKAAVVSAITIPLHHRIASVMKIQY